MGAALDAVLIDLSSTAFENAGSFKLASDAVSSAPNSAIDLLLTISRSSAVSNAIATDDFSTLAAGESSADVVDQAFASLDQGAASADELLLSLV
jgi:hypothetical protein